MISIFLVVQARPSTSEFIESIAVGIFESSNMADNGERPTKRQRVEGVRKSSDRDNLNKNHHANKKKHQRPNQRSTQRVTTNGRLLNPSTRVKVSESDESLSKFPRMFTQPSALCTGDKGIFVTSDRGREKKSLQEVHDLVQEYLEERGIDSSGQSPGKVHDDLPSQIAKGIEDDIAAELSTMRETDTQTSSKPTRPLQLITLDVPCVSFLRFPPGSTLDPVDMVHSLCLSAADASTPQRSRYVKRLTPVLSLGKTLSQGLQKACEEVLPSVFGPNVEGNINPYKFAIRPNTRNNDKLNREEVIKIVADRVQEIGGNMHSVDLTNYDKGILVEVYRGWVGMSIVTNADTTKYKLGFERLKRFNLAEIYASR